MDIQARKLDLIGEFLRISDEDIIDKLESIIRIESKKQPIDKIEPMSMNEFHKLIDQAKQDKANGNVVSHQDLKKRIKTW
ncbi:MAG: hypothetical protein RO257_04850 [Candidatus Kapabacteria bacterium]|jgi:hypothetical protein|nr:hypothetical protein [Candidatus Kapabacteria bacterium]